MFHAEMNIRMLRAPALVLDKTWNLTVGITTGGDSTDGGLQAVSVPLELIIPQKTTFYLETGFLKSICRLKFI
jgi:hypothetical protein